jgi:signal peptidase I
MVDTRSGHDGLFPDADPAPRPGATAAGRRRRSLVEWVVVIAGSVLVALVIKTFVVQAFYIPTGSMEPTLLGERRTDGTRGIGDRVIVDKISYRLHDVSRGDVVVFANPDKAATDHISGGAGTTAAPVDDLIKRVIALPGETVVIKDTHVYVNGRLLPEPYLPAGTVTTNGPGGATWSHACTPTDVCTVPAGTVWVMGDNRTNSQDSRWIGPIAQDTIVGRATTVVWPLNRISGL